jgi:hypothetical protein
MHGSVLAANGLLPEPFGGLPARGPWSVAGRFNGVGIHGPLVGLFSMKPNDRLAIFHHVRRAVRCDGFPERYRGEPMDRIQRSPRATRGIRTGAGEEDGIKEIKVHHLQRKSGRGWNEMAFMGGIRGGVIQPGRSCPDVVRIAAIFPVRSHRTRAAPHSECAARLRDRGARCGRGGS